MDTVTKAVRGSLRSVRAQADFKGGTGAGRGNRTLVFSLEGCCSTIELYPRAGLQIGENAGEVYRPSAIQILPDGVKDIVKHPLRQPARVRIVPAAMIAVVQDHRPLRPLQRVSSGVPENR